MPNRANPLTCTQVLALSGLLWHFGLVEMAWILPVAFAAMLRTGEITEMRRAHVSFHGSKASIMLMGKTGVRTGHSESVVVDDPIAVGLLKFLTYGKSPWTSCIHSVPNGSKDTGSGPFAIDRKSVV